MTDKPLSEALDDWPEPEGTFDEVLERATQARLNDGGCVCCGTQDNLMWRKGDHALAVATICRACKFGACEVCR